MRLIGLAYLLFSSVALMPNPESDARDLYRALRAERQALEQEGERLRLEEECVRSGKPYLIIDLRSRVAELRQGGVALRTAAIVSHRQRPQEVRACTLFTGEAVEAADDSSAFYVQAGFPLRLEEWRESADRWQRLQVWAREVRGLLWHGEVRLGVQGTELVWLRAAVEAATPTIIIPPGGEMAIPAPPEETRITLARLREAGPGN